LIVEKVKELNFMNDCQVLQYVKELTDMLERSAEGREKGDISDLLQKIAEDNRRVLLALGHEPRAVRNRGKIINEDLKEMENAPVGRRTRRGSIHENMGLDIAVSRGKRGEIEKNLAF
jgi:hypothetical protein